MKVKNIEAIFSALMKVNKHSHIKFKLLFVGIEAVPTIPNLIHLYSEKYSIETEVLERVPNSHVEKVSSITDIFLLTAFNGVKGWLPVKAFEYAKELKPIICYPADEGVIDEFLLKTGLGFPFKEEKELLRFLKGLNNVNELADIIKTKFFFYKII